MGFLDQSTNNIIIDAVLTAVGRELLCKNDGSFVIKKFGLADDEVDYGVIRRFGRAVGAEKIEKNTPIMEAFTNCTLGPRYFLMGASDQTMYRLPFLVLTDTNIGNSATKTVTLTRENDTQSGTVVVGQRMAGNENIPPTLIDQMFIVTADPNLLSVTSAVGPPTIDPLTGKATWVVRRNAKLNNQNGGTISFGIGFPTMMRNSANVKAAGATVKGGKKLQGVLQIMGMTSGNTIQLTLVVDTS